MLVWSRLRRLFDIVKWRRRFGRMLPPTDSKPYLQALDALAMEVLGASDGFLSVRGYIVDQPKLLEDPKRLQAIWATAFSDAEIDWPWLNVWKLKFAVLGAVPRMWMVNDFDPVFLLYHVAIFRSRRRDYKHGYVRFGPPLSDEPKEIQSLIASEIDLYANGKEGFSFPPFFPGDRTLASPALPPQRTPKGGVTICAFRGFEFRG
jgi:hypothetical protein